MPPLHAFHAFARFDSVTLRYCGRRTCSIATSASAPTVRDGTFSLLRRGIVQHLGEGRQENRPETSNGAITTAGVSVTWTVRDEVRVELLGMVVQVGQGRAAARRRRNTTVLTVRTASEPQ
jgi:hypothetical protein